MKLNHISRIPFLSLYLLGSVIINNNAYATTNTNINQPSQIKLESNNDNKDAINSLTELSSEKREKFRNNMNNSRSGSKELNLKYKKTKQDMDKILVAENFDKTAYLEKADELVKIDSSKKLVKYKAIAETATGFSAKERKILASYASGKKLKGAKKKNLEN